MTFVDFETSAHDGQPVELYRFISPTTTYRYTSHGSNFTLDGEVFEATPMQRNAMQGTSQDDSPTLDVQISITAQIVQDFAFGIAENSLTLQLLRSHGTAANTSLQWEGAVSSISVDGRVARFRVPSRFGVGLAAAIPSVYYQPQCNHVLYDGRCRVARSGTFLHSTQVTQVSQVSVEVQDVAGRPNDWFRGGEIVRTSDSERRLIIRQTGNDLTLNFPFRTLVAGDQVQLVAGCDRTAATCRDKFTNIENFGGHPLIPILNVFEAGLD